MPFLMMRLIELFLLEQTDGMNWWTTCLQAGASLRSEVHIGTMISACEHLYAAWTVLQSTQIQVWKITSIIICTFPCNSHPPQMTISTSCDTHAVTKRSSSTIVEENEFFTFSSFLPTINILGDIKADQTPPRWGLVGIYVLAVNRYEFCGA